MNANKEPSPMRKVLLPVVLVLFSVGCMETMYCDTYRVLSVPARCSNVAIAFREDRLAKLHEEIREQKLEHLFVLPQARPYPFHQIPLVDINALLDLLALPQTRERDYAIARRAGSAVQSIAIFSL